MALLQQLKDLAMAVAQEKEKSALEEQKRRRVEVIRVLVISN